MSEKLNELYRSLLSVGNLFPDSQGFVKVRFGKETDVALVDGKQLVLPTDAQLNNRDDPRWEKRIGFHPLGELANRPAESEVLAYFRKAVNIRLNVTFGTLALELMDVAASTAVHGNLSPDQQEYLSRLSGVDDETYRAFTQLVRACPATNPLQNFVSVFIKRAGTIGDRRYARVGVVNFPLYQEVVKAKHHPKREVYGVALRVKDRDAIQALLEYMIPGIDEPEQFSQGSNSLVAPGIDALMKAVKAVVLPLNDLIDLYKSVLEDLSELEFNLDWVEAFTGDNLNAWQGEARMIPVLSGNEGLHPQLAAPPPLAAPTFSVPAPPVMPGYQAPGAPVAPAYVGNATPPPPKASAHGVNFREVMAANPALAWQSAQFYQHQPMQPMQPMQPPPTWAMPQGYPQPGYPGAPQWGAPVGYGGGGYGRT